MVNIDIIKKYKFETSKKSVFWVFKRFFDILISILLLPILISVCILLIFLNHFINRGSMFFIQKRMGKNCKPFKAIKFRTMVNANIIKRKHTDPVEIDRITYLGTILRKLRIDELPQIINVLKGDMSLIGPRPDYYEHAIIFLEIIPNYRARHIVRPGISGLSQIRLGYAEGIQATKRKSRVDIYYVKNANFILDLKIFLATIFTILKGFRV